MEKNKTNGKATQSDVAAAVQEIAKPAASQSEVKEDGQVALEGVDVKTETVLSVEDKIRKINELNILVEGRGIMKTHHEKISEMRFGDYDERDTITFYFAKTKTTYVAKSTFLCKIGAAAMIEGLNAKIKEFEEQINF